MHGNEFQSSGDLTSEDMHAPGLSRVSHQRMAWRVLDDVADIPCNGKETPLYEECEIGPMLDTAIKT